MDLPAGTKVEEGLETGQLNFTNKLIEMMRRAFTGYIITSIETLSGIDEAILLIKKGVIIGSYYEFSTSEQEFGEKALPLVLNAELAPIGIMDINGLSNQQLDLIIAFQEKIVLDAEVREKDVEKLIPKQYNPIYKGSTNPQENTKSDLFRKLGLSGFDR